MNISLEVALRLPRQCLARILEQQPWILFEPLVITSTDEGRLQTRGQQGKLSG
jgi:hypothetical protein